MVAKRLKELGRNVDFAYEMVFAALIGGIVGAKLWYVAENGGPLFSGTGLTFYGGLIGGALAVLRVGLVPRRARPAARRRRRADRWPRRTRSGASAASSPATATTARTGTARGRWPIPTAPCRSTRPCTRRRSTRRSRWAAFALLLWRWRDRWRPGTLMAIYLIGAGLERFLVEFVRRNSDAALGLTQPQLVAVVMMLAGGAWLVLPRRRGAHARAA